VISPLIPILTLSNPRSPNAARDGHDLPGLIDERVPGIAAVVLVLAPHLYRCAGRKLRPDFRHAGGKVFLNASASHNDRPIAGLTTGQRPNCVMARTSPDFSRPLRHTFRCTFQVRGSFFRTHREYGVSRRVNLSGNIDLLSPRRSATELEPPGLR
jgi:hypothetical protein